MTFCMEATGEIGGVRERMKNALGRWSAQYLRDSPLALYPGSEDPSECPPLLDGAAPVCLAEPEIAPAAETEPAPGPTESSPETDNRQAHSADNGASNHTRNDEKRNEEQDRDFGRFETKAPPLTDYYEVLQISRNADPETIHRVYRIMVSRFHPDNPRTGDTERFQLLRRAYHVLSDPARRAEYDRAFTWTESRTLPIFELKEFVDSIDGEKNRRLGILSLLYHRRRLNELQPGVSVLDLEQRMGFPREYLNFT